MRSLYIGVTLVSLLSGCNDDGIPADPVLRDYSSTFAPLPSESIYPESNPFSVAKSELGELLFWDPILSGDQNVACATCHHPDFGWADGRQTSIGSDGIGLGPNRFGNQLTDMHSPTILNVAFTGLTVNTVTEDFESGGYFWDLRANTLEAQALQPILSDIEMRGFNVSESQIIEEVLTRLKSNPEYVQRFTDAFGGSDPVTIENLVKAIATFERQVVSNQTRFDAFLSGNTSALTEAEIIGLNKFIDGGCARCHSGPMLADNQIHEGERVVGEQIVRTPTMRNLTLTAPFMHDGSRLSLRDAIAAYEDRGDLQVTLGEGDFGDIERFLNTLDSTGFYRRIPDTVPSGLPVGGDIQ